MADEKTNSGMFSTVRLTNFAAQIGAYCLISMAAATRVEAVKDDRMTTTPDKVFEHQL